jgi:hypothetical protein
MDGCKSKWLGSVVDAIKRFERGGRATLDDLKTELSHLALRTEPRIAISGTPLE